MLCLSTLFLDSTVMKESMCGVGSVRFSACNIHSVPCGNIFCTQAAQARTLHARKVLSLSPSPSLAKDPWKNPRKLPRSGTQKDLPERLGHGCRCRGRPRGGFVSKMKEVHPEEQQQQQLTRDHQRPSTIYSRSKSEACVGSRVVYTESYSYTIAFTYGCGVAVSHASLRHRRTVANISPPLPVPVPPRI